MVVAYTQGPGLLRSDSGFRTRVTDFTEVTGWGWAFPAVLMAVILLLSLSL